MRQNPHVRICGGPGSATTLVYPTAPTHQGAPAGGLTSHPGSLRPTEIPEGPDNHHHAIIINIIVPPCRDT